MKKQAAQILLLYKKAEDDAAKADGKGVSWSTAIPTTLASALLGGGAGYLTAPRRRRGTGALLGAIAGGTIPAGLMTSNKDLQTALLLAGMPTIGALGLNRIMDPIDEKLSGTVSLPIQ